MLKVEGLHTYYDKLHVLRDLNLEVRQGEMVALVGANGAGKTTLLRTISGFVPVTQGNVEFQGVVLNGKAPKQIVQLGVVQVPEGRQVFPEMSVEENLLMGAYLRKDKGQIKREMEEVFAYFPRLRERRKQLAGTMSGGEQQMLAVGRGLLSKPKLLLLDEPSFGLAPTVVEAIVEIIREINERGVTIFIVEQHVNVVLHFVDRAYVLEVGQIALSGTGQELLENEYVKKAYLGL